MERKCKSGMLAKARVKYGKPVYPGRIHETERGNRRDPQESKKNLNDVKQKQSTQTVLEVWNKIKAIIKEEVSPVSYETWIEPCQPVEFATGKFVLMVENAFFKEMIERRYYSTIRNAIKYVVPENITGLELITESEYKFREGVTWKK